MSDERIEINLLHRHTTIIMPVLPGPSFGVPDMEPVRSLVADALEAVTFNKGLHQVDGMAVVIDPVLSETPHNPAQEMAG